MSDDDEIGACVKLAMMSTTHDNNDQNGSVQVNDACAETKNTELISTFLSNLHQNVNYTFNQQTLTPALQQQRLSQLGTQQNTDITYPHNTQQSQIQNTAQSPPVSATNLITSD